MQKLCKNYVKLCKIMYFYVKKYLKFKIYYIIIM